jgi:Asp-tRNA(Asn)/Glu-tRNA(Gln) amidotransferase A subunit family amidase
MTAHVTAAVLAERIAAGAVSARDATEACLARIAERDGAIRAFAHIDPDHARAQADALDRHRKAGRPIGPLHGVPVGVKDIFDTRDYPTENGTALDAGRRPKSDAVVVARLRAAGAVIIGKTVTTELAFFTPGPTRNPHHSEHTPGGSSSGSAAAVADGMIPLAIGSQTAGSVIRPASFCGVVGIKPSRGLVPLTGALALSEPLDTAGVFALHLEDAALLLDAIAGHDPSDPRTRAEPAPRLRVAARSDPPLPPSFAIVEGPTWDEASDDVRGLLAEVEASLGAQADRVPLPDVYANARPALMRIMKVGFARYLAPYAARGGLSPVLSEAVAEGAGTLATDYLAALDWQAVLGSGLDRIFDRYDAIITPAAPGEAPAGVHATGSPAFNVLWTLVGTPAVTLPVARGSSGLPIGLQVVGRFGEDARLMRVARWLQRHLAG